MFNCKKFEFFKHDVSSKLEPQKSEEDLKLNLLEKSQNIEALKEALLLMGEQGFAGATSEKSTEKRESLFLYYGRIIASAEMLDEQISDLKNYISEMR